MERDKNRTAQFSLDSSMLTAVSTSISYRDFNQDALTLNLRLQNFGSLFRASYPLSACSRSERPFTTILGSTCHDEITNICCDQGILENKITNSTLDDIKKLACTRANQTEAILSCSSSGGKQPPLKN
jgi:hypothetical protein